MKKVKITKKQMSVIKDFCYNYGYDVIMAEYEAAFETGTEEYLEYENEMSLPMSDGYPDNFYDLLDDLFGEDRDLEEYYYWNREAENNGMAAALKDITGKDYSIYCDGYRQVAVVGDVERAREYARKKVSNMKWDWLDLSVFNEK